MHSWGARREGGGTDEHVLPQATQVDAANQQALGHSCLSRQADKCQPVLAAPKSQQLCTQPSLQCLSFPSC